MKIDKRRAKSVFEDILADQDFVKELYGVSAFLANEFKNKSMKNDTFISQVLTSAGVQMDRFADFSAVVSALKTLEENGFISFVPPARRIAARQYKQARDAGAFMLTRANLENDERKNNQRGA